MKTSRSSQTLKSDLNTLWHPFTQHSMDTDPLVIERAKGIFLYSSEGFRFDDTISSWWTNLHGHCNPALVRAMTRQARTLDHVNFSGFTHPTATELAVRLGAHLPADLVRFFYSDNGATAVEVALKMAVQYYRNLGRPEKSTFIHLEGSYHGDTLGALAVGGIPEFRRPFESVVGPNRGVARPWCKIPGVPTGNPVHNPCHEPSWAIMENTLRTHFKTLAAVIVEPLILCVGGMHPYSADYLRRLQKLCRELDILVIYDEVATGFGRTGTLFALDQAGTCPDLLCLAKGLSGGVLPLALTITTEKVFDAFTGNDDRTFYHGHSYTANPIACATGIASLKIFEKTRILETMQNPMSEFQGLLAEMEGIPGITDIRYLGWIGAIDISHPLGQRINPGLLGQEIYKESLRHGLVLRPLGDTIYWFLPLVVKSKDVRRILTKSRAVVRTVLDRVSRGSPMDGHAHFV